MGITNSKILFELLPESEQPQKTLFAPNMDLMKHGIVTDIGNKVESTKIGDIITVYVNNIITVKQTQCFCSERDLIFRNGIPQLGKVHVNQQSKDGLSLLMNANVISSNCTDINKDDKVFYRSGQSMELPDNTEIISETQVYYTE